jgi:peroxiredoxin
MLLRVKKIMKPIFQILFFVILLFSSAQTALCETGVNEKSPEFEFVTMDGEKISSEGLKGKIIVLDFWNTRCNGCIKSMPQMEKFYQKYKDDKRLAIYCVNSGWDPIETAKKFTENGRNHFWFWSWGEKYDLPFAYDTGSATMKKFNLNSNPATIIIDKEFNIRVKHSEYVEEFLDFLNKSVEPLLAEKSNKVDNEN